MLCYYYASGCKGEEVAIRGGIRWLAIYQAISFSECPSWSYARAAATGIIIVYAPCIGLFAARLSSGNGDEDGNGYGNGIGEGGGEAKKRKKPYKSIVVDAISVANGRDIRGNRKKRIDKKGLVSVASCRFR